jgi:hypothetical protein
VAARFEASKTATRLTRLTELLTPELVANDAEVPLQEAEESCTLSLSEQSAVHVNVTDCDVALMMSTGDAIVKDVGLTTTVTPVSAHDPSFRTLL